MHDNDYVESHFARSDDGHSAIMMICEKNEDDENETLYLIKKIMNCIMGEYDEESFKHIPKEKARIFIEMLEDII